MLHHQCLVALERQPTDMTQLLRVTDDHRASGAIKQRQRRGDVALAGLVDDDEIELTGIERNAPPDRQ
jgi:hypothetical protein